MKHEEHTKQTWFSLYCSSTGRLCHMTTCCLKTDDLMFSLFFSNSDSKVFIHLPTGDINTSMRSEFTESLRFEPQHLFLPSSHHCTFTWVLKNSFDVLVLYLSISMLFFCLLLLHYISGGSIALFFTWLHLSESLLATTETISWLIH